MTQEYNIQDILKSIAELRESQKETDRFISEKQAKTDEQMKKTNETLKAMFAETDEQMKETNETLKAMFAETGEKMKETDETLKRMGIHLGGISNNNGDVAEEFFFSSLSKNPQLGGLHFDNISPNVLTVRNKKEEEYDILLTNGNMVAIVEVKWKLHTKDLQKLDRKVEHFKEFFPIYKDFTVYGAIAGMSVPKDAEDEALEKGYFVLKQVGNHMEVSQSKHLKVA